MDKVRAIFHSATLRARAEQLVEVIDNLTLSADLRKRAESTMNETIDVAARIEKENLR